MGPGPPWTAGRSYAGDGFATGMLAGIVLSDLAAADGREYEHESAGIECDYGY